VEKVPCESLLIMENKGSAWIPILKTLLMKVGLNILKILEHLN